MAEPAGRDRLEDLPPSCVLVHRILDEEGPMTLTDLCESGYLAERTARRALRRLEDADLIRKRPGHDARTVLYQVSV